MQRLHAEPYNRASSHYKSIWKKVVPKVLLPHEGFISLLFIFQSQGAITEKLRSFSMQDLTAIQGDEPVGQRHYQTLPDTKKRGKGSTNESLGLYIIKALHF